MSDTDAAFLNFYQKRQVTLVYHCSSMEHLDVTFERMRTLTAISDAPIDFAIKLERDKAMREVGWKQRHSNPNYFDYCMPRLNDCMKALLGQRRLRAQKWFDIFGIQMTNPRTLPVVIAACLLLGTLALSPATSKAESLCKASETIVFSCVLKNSKVASICESSEQTKPYLEYRFGKPAKIELTYRASKEDRNRRFHRAEVIGVNTAVDSIWFKNNGHVYDVSLPTRGAPGVQVWKQGEMLANIECKNGWAGTKGKRQTKSAFIIDHGSVNASELDILWYEEQ